MILPVCHYRLIVSFFLLLTFTQAFSQKAAKSFEIRFFTDDPSANGETDFKGETTIFDTPQRMEFLKRYADYARNFFEDPQLAKKVVREDEALKAVANIKPQPLPETRNRIPLKEWKWMGHSKDQEVSHWKQPANWQEREGFKIVDGTLSVATGSAQHTWRFPSQSWRFSFEWKVKVSGNNSKTAFIFSEQGKITGAEIGFNTDGNIYYTTADQKVIEALPYRVDKWYHFKIEFDLASWKRGQDVGRYNLYIDGALIADYVPIQRVVMEGVGYAHGFSSLAKINRLTINAAKGVSLDDIWGVGYHYTGRDSYPYTVETFLDENFEEKPDIADWSTVNYVDSIWQTGVLPLAHGSERYAEEDLYLRKEIFVSDFKRAILNVETLDPSGEVWINGKVAAVVPNRHPQQLDISKYLRKNEKNVIGIKVDHFYLHSEVGELMPHSSLDFNIGWFAGRVSLDLVGPTMIGEAFAYVKQLGNPTVLNLKAVVDNRYWLTFNGFLKVDLSEWFPEESSWPAFSATYPIAAPQLSKTFEYDLQLSDPNLWTQDTTIL